MHFKNCYCKNYKKYIIRIRKFVFNFSISMIVHCEYIEKTLLILLHTITCYNYQSRLDVVAIASA